MSSEKDILNERKTEIQNMHYINELTIFFFFLVIRTTDLLMDRSVLEHTKCPLIDTESLDNM